MASLRRHLPAIISLLLLGAAVLYLVLRNDQLLAVLATWRRIDTPDLVGAIGLVILAQLVVAWRCRVILEGDGLREPQMFWSLGRIQMVTLFAAHGAIIPGFAVGADGSPLMAFGLMGGMMQAQGHLQLALRILGHGQNPQSAADAPRWRVLPRVRFAGARSARAVAHDNLRGLFRPGVAPKHRSDLRPAARVC